MSKSLKVICILVFQLVSILYAHLCDNVFRQEDKLIVKPEIYNIVVKDRATFKVFLQNNMDRGIAEISLIAESPAFDFQIYPQKMSIPKNQRVYFEVTMIPKSHATSGNYSVTFRLVGGGRQFKSFSLDVAGTAQPQIQEKPKPPEDRPVESRPVQKKESGLLSIKKMAQPPKIDGRIIEECWKNAVVAGNFALKGQGKPVYQTVGLFGCDSNFLYLGFYCRDNEPDKISDRDRLEIQISPDISGKTYYSITLSGDGKASFRKISSIGSVQNLSAEELVYAIYKGVNAWMIEIRIPFSSIGATAPSPGDIWNLRMVRTKATSYQEESYWAVDSSASHQEKGFGQICFSP